MDGTMIDFDMHPAQAFERERAFAKEYADARLARALTDFDEALRWKRDLSAALVALNAQQLALKDRGPNEGRLRARREFADRQARLVKELTKAKDAVRAMHEKKDAEVRQSRPVQGWRHWRRDGGEVEGFVWLAPIERDSIRRAARPDEIDLIFSPAGHLVGIQLRGEACGVAPVRGGPISNPLTSDSPYECGYADGFRAGRES